MVSRVCICKHLSHAFPVHNELKQSLTVLKHQKGWLELNGLNLVYAIDNLFGEGEKAYK